MRIWWSIGALLTGLGTVQPALSHPHIFVDVEIEIVFDDAGAAHGIWIGWTYDALFSMLLVSDLGLDQDFSGTLSAEELATLQGFDMNWIEGYHGDTHVTQGDQTLALSGPVEWQSDYRDGQLRSRHLRHLLEQPDPAQPWSVAVYDPTYYTSYGIVGTPQITGRTDCRLAIFEPDWDQAGAQMEAALEELLGAGAELEADFPAVGALFAEEVRVTCAGS